MGKCRHLELDSYGSLSLIPMPIGPTSSYPSIPCSETGTSLSVLWQAVISGHLLFSITLNRSRPHIPHPVSSPGPRAVSTADTGPGHRAGPGSLSLAQGKKGSWSSWSLGFFCELKSAKGATALTRCLSPGLSGAGTSQWQLLHLGPLPPAGQKAAGHGSLHLREETGL